MSADVDPPARQSVGSPVSTWDVGWIAAAARQQDPGLPAETAELLAGQVQRLYADVTELDAPALARALLATNTHIGATAANVVATASIAYVNSHDVSPDPST